MSASCLYVSLISTKQAVSHVSSEAGASRDHVFFAFRLYELWPGMVTICSQKLSGNGLH